MREMEKKNTHSTNRDGLLFRSESRSAGTTSSDFVLQCQWGNRKRSRCMKVHIKDPSGVTNEPAGSGRATARVNRRVVRSDLNNNNTSKDAISNKQNSGTALRSNGGGNGYLNLRQRPASPSPSHRILRNSESPIGGGMRGHSNGVRGLASPDRGERKGTSMSNNINRNNSNNHHHISGGGGGGGSGSSETAHDGKKGGSSSGGDTITAVWPPKFVIALTNKEKEEDFMMLKGSKLPQRPKKRAKFIQRTLNVATAMWGGYNNHRRGLDVSLWHKWSNITYVGGGGRPVLISYDHSVVDLKGSNVEYGLVSPGSWLCDLTLERYEVREKKVTKKRPRGLKAMVLMGTMESESE